MSWDEIDLDAGTWTLPAARSKNKRAHVLPLLPLAASIIRSVPRRASRDLLFGERTPYGFSSWDREKRRLDERADVHDWTIHDLRRTTATRLADIGVAPHLIEHILNHQSGHRSGVAGIYNRSSYARETRNVLALWQDHIRTLVEGGTRKVLPFAT